ncbi:MAG: carbon monoxide dehydrogenase medium chain [Blastococcus sp.]|jgi:carbon-monoxide dehydrogenase medium subunit|nr:carbon monoxide dehydrogenase medium chain [Blastococcus sp.]
MKPGPFDYASPRSLAEALTLLDRHGDEAKVLAGGQSLGPLLNLRLARPLLLVDVNRVPELSSVPRISGGWLTFPALTRYRALERSATVAAASPLIAEAVPFVGHRAIRNLGTLGGSLAHADPTAELPCVVTALDAEIWVRSVDGERRLPAGEFFKGCFTTDLRPDELLTTIRVPARRPGTGHAWLEAAPRHGDYATVGVAAVVGVDAGVVTRLSLVYAGVADVPYRHRAAEAAAVGQPAHAETFAAAVESAVGTMRPPDDLTASAKYRRHLARLLGLRALALAASRARADASTDMHESAAASEGGPC